jgi:Proteasome complex subunit Rpn13 ubiquitin receptor
MCIVNEFIIYLQRFYIHVEKVAVASGDRVFLLQVTGTPRRHFYWMQNKDSATVSFLSIGYC